MLKNVIFDFGGVLIDLDIPRCISRLGEHFGITTLSTEPYQSIFRRNEVGTTSEDEFVAELQAQSDQHIDRQEIIDVWNSMIGKVPQHRLDMLKSLSNNYNLYLLSNTNTTHIAHVYEYLKKEYDIDDFGKEYFTKDYFSHLVKMRKPNLDIYHHVLQDAQINGQESIFIDDNESNVMGARAAGMHSIAHDPKVDIAKVIEGYLQQGVG